MFASLAVFAFTVVFLSVAFAILLPILASLAIFPSFSALAIFFAMFAFGQDLIEFIVNHEAQVIDIALESSDRFSELEGGHASHLVIQVSKISIHSVHSIHAHFVVDFVKFVIYISKLLVNELIHCWAIDQGIISIRVYNVVVSFGAILTGFPKTILRILPLDADKVLRALVLAFKSAIISHLTITIMRASNLNIVAIGVVHPGFS